MSTESDSFESPRRRSNALGSFLSWLGYGRESSSSPETRPQQPEEPDDYEETLSDLRQQQKQEAALQEEWQAEYIRLQEKRRSRRERFASMKEEKDLEFSRLLEAGTRILEKELNKEPAPLGTAVESRVTDDTPPPLEQPENTPHATTHELTTLYKTDHYCPPTPELLNTHASGRQFVVSEVELERQQRQLQETLDNFMIDAQVWDAIVGPRITQIRVKPGRGVRVEAISALQRDIALSLSAMSVRIQAPIPGEPFVGIEVPNGNETPLYLRHMLEAPEWRNSKAAIPLILGMDITGEVVVTDLAAAPHMLIAGATGSGKSVCMNSLIMCILQQFTPEEMRMVLIDPKWVEFSVYANIPHLATPVVTDAKQVIPVLGWVVREMESRYALLSEHGARNITAFNAMAESVNEKKLPYLVVIIDELADMMMTARGDVETLLARLAQLSRAVGIHTIIATQRPSVNVLSGIIKANYPTRIAFQVTSQIDSRTILDGKGAEQLRGRGDMLFCPPGIGRLMRIQGPLIGDDEIERVVQFMSDQCDQTFINNTFITQSALTPGSLDSAPEPDDPMLQSAMEIIIRDQRASTSYLQRCLRIGYNRAANLMDTLEMQGKVGPQIGSAPREIFITAMDLQEN